MKKILLTLALLILFIPGVDADTTVDFVIQDFQDLNTVNNESCSNYKGYYYYTNFENFISDSNNKEIFDTLYYDIKSYYNNNLKNDYPYYVISVDIFSSSQNSLVLDTVLLRLSLYNSSMERFGGYETRYQNKTYYSTYTPTAGACNSKYPNVYSFKTFYKSSLDSPWRYTPLALFESNIDFTVINDYGDDNLTFNIYDSKNNLLNTYSTGDLQPKFLDTTYDNYISPNYNTVNLDNYQYVILSLKDYSKNDAFNTNLQVKGMIGITPVYEFGTIEKTEITDRCNISYSDYTDYRLYILKNDLINNAVYYVKACEEGSLFRFDSTIFNITYITTDTVDNPVITVGGAQYNIIPFNKLSNSANENEENNFIPGASEDSLANIIDNIEQFTTDIWNAVQSFMGLVTKFFNTLPSEIRYLSITAFTVLIFISIIKFVKG